MTACAGVAGIASTIATSPEASTGCWADVESVTPSMALDADATAADSDSDILLNLFDKLAGGGTGRCRPQNRNLLFTNVGRAEGQRTNVARELSFQQFSV